MPRVRIIHWKVDEVAPLIDACKAGGHDVQFEDADYPTQAKALRANPPDVVVIDLTCRPSHGRELGSALRRSKSTRSIPIVFVNGAPEKVAAVREQLPDATFAATKTLCAKIKSACAKLVANPVVPAGVMERYSTRTVAQKLGIKEGLTVAVFDPPRDYTTALGVLPEGVELIEDPHGVHAVTLWFVRDPRVYQADMRRMQALADRTRLWVVWRKNSTNGLTQYVVRDTALEAGLVDYKICAVNSEWSGMAFARRKK